MVDPEAAEVVKRIFAMTIDGYGPYQIASKLKEEKILIPSAYLAQHGEGVNKNKTFKDVYGWGSSTICNILEKREYLGHTINFKTRKHFKDKKSHYVPEDEWTIFENTHEPIIDQQTFDLVQKIRGNVRRYPDGWGEAAPLTGLLYCADCGGKMYVHRTNNGKRISQYTCSQYSKVPVGKLCTTQHRINEDVVLSLVSEMLKAIAEYAKHDRAEFVRVVQEAQSSQQTAEVINRRSHSRSKYRVNIPPAQDSFNSVRAEFTGMLKNQIAKSNNGIERSKYITFGLPAGSIGEARPRLERVEADVTGNLKRLGVPSEALDGRERLALLHGQMHPGSREAFCFSWQDIPKTGMGTKDYIAPDSFDFRQSRTFRVGQYWGAASYLQILASELSDKLLSEILELDAELTVTMHVQTVDQLKAIKTVKGKLSDIGKMKVEEQRKAVRAGYDPDILPPDLITFSKDAAELLADLQSRNERMFLLTFTVVNLAPTRQRLENDVFTVGGIAQKYNCALKRLDWQQEQGFVSSLALGYNEVEIQRGMTTSSTAIFIPFMTRELRMAGPSLYYGMNALSHNVIMADRKKLKSANGLYLGSTGSGKSFAAKRELLNVFLTIPKDRILIVDPMGEYAPLVRRLGGQVIEIAPGSPSHINPMDIQLDLDDDESPLSMKADFLLSLCELVVGGKDGLQPIEKTVIDRCVRLIYRDMALGIGDGKPPLLQDLYEELLKQPEPEARRVATALELYCTGSLNLFNHPTNVDLTARVVCIVLKGLGENLRKIAMHITNDFVTSAVNVNFHSGISTWCYFDEFHILLRDALTASYFVAVWKMLRKKGCVPSALTQNVKDLLASREIEAILDNTDFMILLAQAQSDRAILAKQLGISEHQLSYITHSNAGEGLLFYGDVTIPFVDRFPKGEIYNLLTTRPEDLKHEAGNE